MKTFDKIQEVSLLLSYSSQFRDELNKNKAGNNNLNNLNNENNNNDDIKNNENENNENINNINNNFLLDKKNELLEFKNDFLQMKSLLLSQKRNPDDKIEKTLDKKNVEILFALKYGVGAKDYSSIARAKDLKPVDLALEKLSDRAKDMSHRISFSQSHEDMFEFFLDSISSKVMIFSSIVIVIMILVGYMETLYLKNFMRRRKII